MLECPRERKFNPFRAGPNDLTCQHGVGSLQSGALAIAQPPAPSRTKHLLPNRGCGTGKGQEEAYISDLFKRGDGSGIAVDSSDGCVEAHVSRVSCGLLNIVLLAHNVRRTAGCVCALVPELCSSCFVYVQDSGV